RCLSHGWSPHRSGACVVPHAKHNTTLPDFVASQLADPRTLYPTVASPAFGQIIQVVTDQGDAGGRLHGPSIAIPDCAAKVGRVRGAEPQQLSGPPRGAAPTISQSEGNAMKRNVCMTALAVVMATTACGKRQAPVQPEPQPQTPPPVEAPPARPAPAPVNDDAAAREAERRRMISILEQVV